MTLSKYVFYIKLIAPRKLFIIIVDLFIVNLLAIPYKVPAHCDWRLGGYKAMLFSVQHARARQGQRGISDQHRSEHHRQLASSVGSAPWSNSGVGFHPRVEWSGHQGPLLAGGRRPPRHWHGGRQCGYRVQPSPQGRADGPWPKPKSNSGCFFLTCFSKNHFRNWLCRAHGVP